MFDLLASLLKKKPAEAPPAGVAPPAPTDATPGTVKDEQTPIYQSLAMTADMREALFPTTPQMVSAIFERPVPSKAPLPPLPPAQPQAPAGESGSFPTSFGRL